MSKYWDEDDLGLRAMVLSTPPPSPLLGRDDDSTNDDTDDAEDSDTEDLLSLSPILPPSLLRPPITKLAPRPVSSTSAIPGRRYLKAPRRPKPFPQSTVPAGRRIVKAPRRRTKTTPPAGKTTAQRNPVAGRRYLVAPRRNKAGGGKPSRRRSRRE